MLNKIILLIVSGLLQIFAQTIPNPQSGLITGVNFDWNSFIRLAQGSDNFPITWADDNSQYTSWGDGGGFGGDNTLGRVSLGVARIVGDQDSIVGINVYGGFQPENPSLIDGKSYGIISINGTLYMWVGPGSDSYNFTEARLYVSTNHAATWQANNWAFIKSDSIILPSFCQFGKDYANARDEFVYIYSPRYKSDSLQIPGEIDLMRVNKNQILNRNAYEFFKGTDISGLPIWTTNLQERLPVFHDANGLGAGLGVSVIFVSGLNRYILLKEHGDFGQGNMGIFEAPEPWGPWKTVLYQNSFGVPGNNQTSFYYTISSKWLSSDGKNFVLIFSGINAYDSWNSVEGTFIISDQSPPSIPAEPRSEIIKSLGAKLFWNPSADPESGIAYYKVYKNGNYFTQLADTVFLDSVIYPSLDYYYQISAVNNARIESGLSNSIHFSIAHRVDLKFLFEGLYNSGEMVPDTAIIFLKEQHSPYQTVDSIKVLVNELGNTILFFEENFEDSSYYLMIRHRNCIDTWSAIPIQFSVPNVIYDFTDSISRAFGDNLVLKEGKYCIYSGDVNEDGVVDLQDLVLIDNHAFIFASGYLHTDLNADEMVDLVDIILADINNYIFVSVVSPPIK